MSDIDAIIGSAAIPRLDVLLPMFGVVQRMGSMYSNIKFARARCEAVIRRAALVIKEIDDRSQNYGLNVSTSSLEELQKKFEDIQAIVWKLADMSFFKALLRSDEINHEIQRATQLLNECLHSFEIGELFDAQTDRDQALKMDRAALLEILGTLTGSYREVCLHLEIHNREEEDQAMAAMEKKLRSTSATSQGALEIQIIRRSLECIVSWTGRSAPKQPNWLVTVYDLEFDGEIGGGGYSTVSKAQFKGTTVAVKSLKDVGKGKETLEREIEIWSRLRHDHIVPFYGASTLSSPPYIVSGYMKNGNLVQYLSIETDVDRTKLIHEISLGMLYLHDEKIVHGDLKGLNILVDDSGKACITDFGLSKYRRSGIEGTISGPNAGTLRYLPPEALEGRPLTFASDVYAYGMVIYEVFTGEVPFSREPDDLVRKGCLELTRPASKRVYERGLNDALWGLVLDCISRHPSKRPPFAMIHRTLKTMRNADMLSHALMRVVLADEETTHVGGTVPTVSSSRKLEHSRPLVGSHSSGQQPSITSNPSLVSDINNVPPMRVEVTLRYYGVEFGLTKSREPGILVHLEENTAFKWHPLSPKKGSLLLTDGDRFAFRRSIGTGHNMWELEGSNVIYRSSDVDHAVCRFGNAQQARSWFELQLSYARNGTTGAWGIPYLVGDWCPTTLSWRRVVRGKLQRASSLEGNSNIVPPDRSWTSVDLPKRLAMQDSGLLGPQNSIVCLIDPHSAEPGKFCCRMQGRTVSCDTYRHHADETPIMTREEAYSSEEEAQVMLEVMWTLLGKATEKTFKRSFFSFRA